MGDTFGRNRQIVSTEVPYFGLREAAKSRGYLVNEILSLTLYGRYIEEFIYNSWTQIFPKVLDGSMSWAVRESLTDFDSVF